jgi:outer membrane protein insertion porin family
MQTRLSASLVVVLCGSARAQDAPAKPAHEPSDEEADPKRAIAPLSTPAQPRPTPPPPSRGPTGKFQVGVGYSTDAHFVAHASISQSNLFGTGDSLALDAQLSSLRQLVALRFADPHFLDTDFSLGASVYADHRQLPGFTRAATGATVTLGHALGDHVYAYVGYRLEHVSASTGDRNAAARVLDPGEPGFGVGPSLRSGMISSLRAGLTYNTLDTPLLPHRGTTIGASFEVADPLLGSDFQLTRATMSLSTHQPIGPFTLHLGAHLSAIDSTDPLGVPLTERLFLAGSTDIRGYALGALGPIDPLTGNPIGGNALFAGHIELEVPLIPRHGVSVEGFYDVGGVLDRGGAGQIGRSTGFGLIWRSPLGPLRLDLAF